MSKNIFHVTQHDCVLQESKQEYHDSTSREINRVNKSAQINRVNKSTTTPRAEK